jgi:hypothetical protein
MTERFNIKCYKIFISHSYAFREEYFRLVAMLNRAARRDPSWRWQNLSVPYDEPIMTNEQARQGEFYIHKMTEQKLRVNAVLMILRPIAIESESVFLEVFISAPVGRPTIPLIGVLPRGVTLVNWTSHWGVATVKWHPNSIIRAVRQFAAPATLDELCLTPEENAERQQIIQALESNAWHRARSAQALGISRTKLWQKMRTYIIQKDSS